MPDDMSSMKINIPQELITNTIMAEMVKQIGGDNKQELIKAVVEHAMTAKNDRYSNATFFQDSVNEMIRKVAVDSFGKWLRKNEDDIAAALEKYLIDNKQRQLTAFCKGLADKIQSYGIRVNLDLTDNRD